MGSERVAEVRELAELLEENHIHKAAALRTAIECVYGMKEDFCRHNYSGRDMQAEDDEAWGLKNSMAQACAFTQTRS